MVSQLQWTARMAKDVTSNAPPPRSDLRRALACGCVAIVTLTSVAPSLVTMTPSGVARPDPIASEERLLAASPGDLVVRDRAAPLPRTFLADVTLLLLPGSELPPAPTSTPVATPGAVPIARAAVMVAGGPALVVTASWYGPGFFENRLPCWQWLQASGLPIQLLPDTWGVAHKTLPCGTLLRLTHGANAITVPVVDRGPYVTGREIDLAPEVKAALGCSDLCTVVAQIP